MGIVESGAAADNKEYFNILGYQKFVLKCSRQIASGIIVFIKLSLKAKLVASCKMTAEDKLEFFKIHVGGIRLSLRYTFCTLLQIIRTDFERLILD